MTRQRTSGLLGPLEERILGILLLRTEREWYRSELARQLRTSPSSLQRPLRRLTDIGVIETRKDGNRLYYRADTDNPVFPELQGLLAKTSGLVGVLRASLEDLSSEISLAFVYGSMASGEAGSSSDVDLLIVGSVGRLEVTRSLRDASRTLGREINPSIYGQKELARKLEAEDRFLRGILNKPKLFVLGTEDDLARLAGPQEGSTRADGR